MLASDPDEDNLMYLIDWGDGVEEIIGPFSSGDEQKVTHIWERQGEYDIRLKSRDICFCESDYAILRVTMPKIRQSNHPFMSFFETHPILFRFLQRIF